MYGCNTGAFAFARCECLPNLSEIPSVPDQQADADPGVQLIHVYLLGCGSHRWEVTVEIGRSANVVSVRGHYRVLDEVWVQEDHVRAIW